jgi:hypothetical protein
MRAAEPKVDVVQFKPGALIDEISARGVPNQICKRDLARYYALLDRSLRKVHLTEAEALLICDALNSRRFDEHSCEHVRMCIRETMRFDELDKKWGVDVESFNAKLEEMTSSRLLALVDAAERFWRNPTPREAALRRVGLVH